MTNLLIADVLADRVTCCQPIAADFDGGDFVAAGKLADEIRGVGGKLCAPALIEISESMSRPCFGADIGVLS
jgi:hypothetical protein